MRKTFWTVRRALFVMTAGFLIGIPLVKYGLDYFTKIIPEQPELIIFTLVGTIIVGLFAEFVYKYAFEK